MTDELKKQRELINCNLVKTVLMIIIVFYHSILFWNGKWFNNDIIGQGYVVSILSYLSKWLNTFHVQTFTLVSGYIFYFIKYEKNSYNYALPFIKNKIKRLIVPYIFAAVIWVIPISTFYFHFSISEIINKYVVGIAPSQLWFLLMLFVVFIIFYFLSNLFQNHNMIGLILIFILYGVGKVTPIPNVFQLFTGLQYVIFFYIGFKFRQYHLLKYIKNSVIVVLFILDIGLFIVNQYLDDLNSKLIMIFNLGVGLLINIIGSILIFSLLQKISNNINFTDSKLFLFFSKRSMGVYLFHQQIIYFCLHMLNGVINPYVNAIVNFTIAISISLLISSVLLKFKATCFLIGEKFNG